MDAALYAARIIRRANAGPAPSFQKPWTDPGKSSVAGAKPRCRITAQRRDTTTCWQILRRSHRRAKDFGKVTAAGRVQDADEVVVKKEEGFWGWLQVFFSLGYIVQSRRFVNAISFFRAWILRCDSSMNSSSMPVSAQQQATGFNTSPHKATAAELRGATNKLFLPATRSNTEHASFSLFTELLRASYSRRAS